MLEGWTVRAWSSELELSLMPTPSLTSEVDKGASRIADDARLSLWLVSQLSVDVQAWSEQASSLTCFELDLVSSSFPDHRTASPVPIIAELTDSLRL